ncbi:hypothetical protein ACO0QE_003264 [Hanseniaspora vineae]
MPGSKLRVGFIGLSGKKGWAIKSHFTVIQNLSDYFEIVAISNSSMEASCKTIEELKLPNCKPFGNDYESFAQYDQLDMVVVSVKVTAHYSIIMDLLNFKHKNSGLCNFKILLVEWALGNGLQEASNIYELCNKTNVQSVISLQGRYSPHMLLAKKLIDENRIGKINSIDVTANAGWYGYQRPYNSPDYLYDIHSGHNMITTAFAHTIDSIQYIVGAYVQRLNAMIFNNIKQQEVIGPKNVSMGVFKPKSVPDHVLFQGSISNTGNIPISVSFQGGTPTNSFTKNLVINVHGTKGDLKIEGNAGFPQISNLALYFCGVPLTSEKGQTDGTSKFGLNDLQYNNKTTLKDQHYNNQSHNLMDPQLKAGMFFSQNTHSGKQEREEEHQVVEKYQLNNYNPVVGNMMRLYEAILRYYNHDIVYDAQGFATEGFPTFKDAILLHQLIDSVFESNELSRTVDPNIHL